LRVTNGASIAIVRALNRTIGAIAALEGKLDPDS
jgi:hypothetical protein